MKYTVLAVAFAGYAAAAAGAPETYSLDPLHTQVRYGYDMFSGWMYQQHRFDKASGKIVYDREAKTASVDVTIDAKSIHVGGDPSFTGQMQSAQFFDVANYPTITYKSTGVKFEGDKPVSIDGNLTIKGITKPVTLTVTSFTAGQHPAQKARQAIGAQAKGRVKRSDFNMTYNPAVADDVDLTFTVQAFKDPS